MLPISEIFYSIQGEGLNIGRPSIFIRLYYCNLYCTWCDTKYTWENQSKAKEGIDYYSMDYDSIIKEISKYNCKSIVITGGEPLINQNKLAPLVKLLKNLGYYIEIETNGTLIPIKELIENVDLFTVSPKLSNSGVKEDQRIREDALHFFSKLDKTIFKFVIQERKDLNEVLDIIEKFKIERRRVFLMPEGTDRDILDLRSSWIIEECKKHDFKFSPRLHIMLWGNKRGV